MDSVHNTNTLFFHICKSLIKLCPSPGRRFMWGKVRIREFNRDVRIQNPANTLKARRQPPMSMIPCDNGPMISVPKLLPATVIPVATDRYLSKYSGVMVMVGDVAMQVPTPYSREKLTNSNAVDVAKEESRSDVAQMTPPVAMTLLLPKRPTSMLVIGPKVIDNPYAREPIHAEIKNKTPNDTLYVNIYCLGVHVYRVLIGLQHYWQRSLSIKHFLV